MSVSTDIKTSWPVAAVLVLSAIVGVVLYDCGKGRSASEVAALSTQLAENEQTVQIKDGLYATKVAELANVQNLLDGSTAAVAALKKQLSDSQAQLLTTQQVSLGWKAAYQGALAATQKVPTTPPTTVPVVTPPVPGPAAQRTEVDFAGDLGPIHASGYTLTDPAQAYLSLSQLRPLVLTVSVARNRDGAWQSYVTSSEPNIEAKVNLAGVDPGIISPTWRERIWMDAGVDFLAGRRASLGVSYHFDRWSLGTSCSVWSGGDGCGLTAGFRLFK